MSRNKNKTDRPFSERLRHYEADPPEQVWHAIASALQSDKRRRQVMWVSRIAASIAILLAIGTTLFLLREPQETRMVTREETATGRAEIPGPEAGTDVRETGTESIDRQTKVNLAFAIVPPSHTGRMNDAREDTIPGDRHYPDQLKTLPPKPPTGLRTEFADPGILLAKRHDPPAGPETGEGIDVFEQWDDGNTATHDKWGVGTQISPIYSYRNLDGGSAISASYYDDVEEGIISYAGGVNVHYAPHKRLSIQSGLYYSSLGMKIGNAYYASVDNENSYMDGASFAQAFINNSTGIIETEEGLDHAYAANYIPPSSWELTSQNAKANALNAPEGEILQQFEYLELPLILRYRVVDRKLGFHFLGGLSSNFLVGNSAYYQEEGEKEQIGTTANLRPVNYSSVVGLGLDYSISQRFHVNIEPTFRYYLNSINTGSMIRSHPYTVGFFTGLLYTF